MWQCSLSDCKRKFTCWVCINICRATANLYTVQCVCTGPIASLGSKRICQNTVNWKRSQRSAIGQDNQQAQCMQNRYTTLFSQGKWELPKWKKQSRLWSRGLYNSLLHKCKTAWKGSLEKSSSSTQIGDHSEALCDIYTLTRLVFSDDFRTNYS